jgi:hypothetical protein
LDVASQNHDQKKPVGFFYLASDNDDDPLNDDFGRVCWMRWEEKRAGRMIVVIAWSGRSRPIKAS